MRSLVAAADLLASAQAIGATHPKSHPYASKEPHFTLETTLVGRPKRPNHPCLVRENHSQSTPSDKTAEGRHPQNESEGASTHTILSARGVRERGIVQGHMSRRAATCPCRCPCQLHRRRPVARRRASTQAQAAGSDVRAATSHAGTRRTTSVVKKPGPTHASITSQRGSRERPVAVPRHIATRAYWRAAHNRDSGGTRSSTYKRKGRGSPSTHSLSLASPPSVSYAWGTARGQSEQARPSRTASPTSMAAQANHRQGVRFDAVSAGTLTPRPSPAWRWRLTGAAPASTRPRFRLGAVSSGAHDKDDTTQLSTGRAGEKTKCGRGGEKKSAGTATVQDSGTARESMVVVWLGDGLHSGTARSSIVGGDVRLCTKG